MESDSKPALPEGFRVEEYDATTTLSWRWFHGGHVLMAVLCVACNGTLLLLYSRVSEPSLLVTLGLVLFLLPGAVVSYITLASLLNTTRIEASRGGLRIQHGPVPWFGNLTLSGRELRQLYSRKIENKKLISYKLFALDRKGHEVVLLDHFDTEEQVLYAEQALERVLAIEDRPVEGELALHSARTSKEA